MNKRPFVPIALALLTLASAHAETRVGVSIGIQQPGAYGRIDIGNAPPPPVIYTQPVVIMPSRVAEHRRPIYLYVPPGHQKNWAKHCRRYDACGQPVYFVQERWVADRYDERQHERGGGQDDRGHKDKGHKDKGNKGRGHD